MIFLLPLLFCVPYQSWCKNPSESGAIRSDPLAKDGPEVLLDNWGNLTRPPEGRSIYPCQNHTHSGVKPGTSLWWSFILTFSSLCCQLLYLSILSCPIMFFHAQLCVLLRRCPLSYYLSVWSPCLSCISRLRVLYKLCAFQLITTLQLCSEVKRTTLP